MTEKIDKSLPIYESDKIQTIVDQAKQYLDDFSRDLVNPYNDILESLLNHMPHVLKIIYNIHDSINFGEDKITKDEMFSRFTPDEYKESINGAKGGDTIVEENERLKADIKVILEEKNAFERELIDLKSVAQIDGVDKADDSLKDLLKIECIKNESL